MSSNKKETKRQPQDVFDHNFEVIYEGELPELPNDLGSDDYKDVLSNLSELDTTSSLGIDYLEQNRTRTFSNLPDTQPASRHRSGKQYKKSTADLLLQTATLLLIVLITGILAVTFWSRNTPYTDDIAALPGRNYILGAYYGVSLFLLLIEWITFLNVLLNSNTPRGRGMFSFLIIYLGSLLSFCFAGQFPAAPAFLAGIREALTVYGTLHRPLLLLCSVGIIICMIRRFHMMHKS